MSDEQSKPYFDQPAVNVASADPSRDKDPRADPVVAPKRPIPTRDGLRRGLLIACLFAATLMLAVNLAGSSLHDPQLRWFNLTTACAFTLLTIISVLRIYRFNRALADLTRVMPRETLARCHRSLLHLREAKDPTSADGPAPFHTAEEVLGELAARLLGAVHSGRRAWPGFICRHVEAIGWALQRCSESPDNSGKLLSTGISPLSPHVPWRSLSQVLSSLLLIVGIVGTFYGLYGAFSSDLVVHLVDAMQRNAPFGDLLGALLDAFQLAFGSSLLAYTCYPAGRFMLAVVDEDYGSLARYFECDLKPGLIAAVSPLDVGLRVDLPEATKARLDLQAVAITEAVVQSTRQTDELNGLVRSVTRGAAVTRRSMAQVAKATGTILHSLREAREEWQAATRSWADATARFSDSGQSFQAGVERLESGLEGTRNALEATSDTVRDQWTNSVRKASEKMDQTTTEITGAWSVASREITAELAAGVSAFENKLAALRERMNQTIEDFRAMEQGVSDAVQSLAVNQVDLRAALDAMGTEQQVGREQMLAAVAASLATLAEQEREHRHVLDALADALQTSVSRSEALHDVLSGQGENPDLASVLTALHDHIGAVDAWQKHAPQRWKLGLVSHDSDEIGQSPLVDVAMMAVGGMTVLMLLFLVLAAVSTAKTEEITPAEEPAPTCRTITDEAEASRLRDQVQRWADWAQSHVRGWLQFLENQCGLATLPEPENSLLGAGPAPTLPQIQDLCPEDAAHILAPLGPGLHRVNLLSLASRERQQLPRNCVVVRRCVDPGPAREEALVAAVEAWWQESIARERADARLLQQACDMTSPSAEGDRVPARTDLPSMLDGVCPEATTRVLGQAGLSIEQIQAQRRRSRALTVALRHCLANRPEIIEVPEEVLRFRSCSTDFVAADDPHRRLGDEEVFDVLHPVLLRTERAITLRGHNRIDVLGHADQRPVRNACEYARDNAMLSSLRAHAVRDALLRALSERELRYPTLAAQVLNGKTVRIYAIGVGDAEPKQHCMRLESESELCHAINRRIEIRTARDLLIGSTRP